MIQNYDNFSKSNVKFGKICTLWDFIFIQKWLTKKCNILRQLYMFLITSCKIFHSYEKMKKTSQSFYEVIMLAPLNIFAPTYLNY
jgi:hypothetical protein